MANDLTRFDVEMRAYKSLADLAQKAQEVRNEFVNAGLDLPPMLARFFAEDNDEDASALFNVPPLKSPPRPPEAKNDWIWVGTKDLSAQTLVLGILRFDGRPMTAKSVSDEALKINPSLNQGSIYNIGPRLEEAGVIDRNVNGWTLRDVDKSPVLHEGNAWGAVDVFQKSELAAHRRQVILHILRVSADGLMQMQIVRQLESSSFCRAPIAKDIVKLDIKVLAEAGEIRRIGRTKKWTAANKGPS